MRRSETLTKLLPAFIKAQAALPALLRDKTNPHFGSRYAELSSVIEAVREPLSKHDLAVVQTTDVRFDPPGGGLPTVNVVESSQVVVVETTLFHASGEYISGTLIMRPVKADPQGIGSCITYARRYALMAMVGIAPEDDDAERASGRNGADKEEPHPRARKKKEAPTGEPGAPGATEKDDEVPSDEEKCIAGIRDMAEALGYRERAVTATISRAKKEGRLKDLHATLYKELNGKTKTEV